MINIPAESFFSDAKILLMFVLDAHSCFFRALVQTFVASVLDQCNSTIYGTSSKLHQYCFPIRSPHFYLCAHTREPIFALKSA